MGWNAQDIEKLRKQNNGQKSTAGTGQSAGKSNQNPTSGSLSAQAKASRAAGSAAAKSSGSGKASGRAAGTTGGTAGTNALKGSIVVPFTAALLRSRGKSDTSIANALQKDGYTTSEIAKILQQMNQ